jgi:hypothetical protein
MTAAKLTTKEAMDRAGVSRHALMRAKKKGELWAEKDNQDNLMWDAAALDRWKAERPEPTPPAPASTAPPDVWEAVATARERAAKAEGERDGLRVALAAEKARADAAEANAERWREAAEKRRRWWPFG